MNEFGWANRREGDILIANHVDCIGNLSFNGKPSSFGPDPHA
jgi:hypothetical protein